MARVDSVEQTAQHAAPAPALVACAGGPTGDGLVFAAIGRCVEELVPTDRQAPPFGGVGQGAPQIPDPGPEVRGKDQRHQHDECYTLHGSSSGRMAPPRMASASTSWPACTS